MKNNSRNFNAAVAVVPHSMALPTPSWTAGLPTLAGQLVAIRDLRVSDAPTLLGMLGSDEVGRFISSPPATADEFERFIIGTHRLRAEGRCLCFAIVPHGLDEPVGVIQIRQLDPTFETAEWGFAIGSAFWATGVFLDAARLALRFAFETLGVHRLEARATVTNGRGNGVLRKLGAIHEGVLRRSLLREGEYVDQALWTILAEEWRMAQSDPLLSRIH